MIAAYFHDWTQNELLPLEYVLPIMLVVALAVWWERSRKRTELERAFSTFRSMLLLYGGIVIYFLFSIPSAISVDHLSDLAKLDTSGLPPELLDHLKEQNSALVRLLEIAHWYLFVTVFWFVAGTYEFLRVLRNYARNATENRTE